ncbi:MAG: helix-turn-helix domain-containing protein [Rhabdochlamydiaceae bacterium]
MNGTKASHHFSVEEVKKKMDEAARPLYRKRWRIIYHALVDPQPAEVIALHCGVAKDTVHKLISRYNRFGLTAIETPGKGGRKRFYLTLEQEKQFLQPFFEQAAKGEIATCAKIHAAYEACIGGSVDESTIYRLLARHGWRKIIPRPRHPKAEKEQQEAFKKTSRRSLSK